MLRQYEEMIDAEDAENWDGRGDLIFICIQTESVFQGCSSMTPTAEQLPKAVFDVCQLGKKIKKAPPRGFRSPAKPCNSAHEAASGKGWSGSGGGFIFTSSSCVPH